MDKQKLLVIADRLDRVADKFVKRAVIDEHGKNGHFAYLKAEAANIRSAVTAKKEKE